MSRYFRAKLVQERLIEASPVPFTILRSTQFFPFISGIIQSGSVGGQVHLAPAMVQPVAADDVADALVDLALAPPLNGVVEIAGPQAIRLDRFAEEYLSAREDPREIVIDPQAAYFGVRLDDRSLTPGAHPRLGTTTLEDWLRDSISAD
jgi:uncharacterized protein YbjT (DUF2867 family)